MNISFKALNEADFPLLLKWLEMPHVKKWWDQDIKYTQELIAEKYSSYTKNYKIVNGVSKEIFGYIIYIKQVAIGYIQTYNAYDFEFDLEKYINELPKTLGALDIFIGEENYIGRGIGARAIEIFVEQYILPKYKYAFVVADYQNEQAIYAYERAGFEIIKRVDNVFVMLKTAMNYISNNCIAINCSIKKLRLSLQELVWLEVIFTKYFLAEDRLWLFGSRADINKKGGDIDLYIETHVKNIDDGLERKANFYIALENKIGEQKIDILLNMVNFPYELAIYAAAKSEGVRII